MSTIRNVALSLQVSDILRHEAERHNETLLKTAQWAVKRALELAEPALVSRFLTIRELHNGTLHLEGVALNLGPLAAKVLAGAEAVLVGVVTLGPALEDEVAHLSQNDALLEAYLLDQSGINAVFQTAKVLGRLAEERAAMRNWGVGAILSPGALAGWAASDQRHLCRLVDMEAIGVHLAASGVLKPYKSMSAMIGLGPGYSSHLTQEACRYCALKKRCQLQEHFSEKTSNEI
jgi:hypothetical protein